MSPSACPAPSNHRMISRSFLLNLCGCDKTGGLRTWAIMIILFLFKRFYSNLLPYPSLTLGVLSKDFKPDESKVPQNLRNSRCFLLLQEEERSSQDSDAKRVPTPIILTSSVQCITIPSKANGLYPQHYRRCPCWLLFFLATNCSSGIAVSCVVSYAAAAHCAQ